MHTIKSCAISDLGLRRTINEDSYLSSQDKKLFIVADGLGGEAAGEWASQICVSAVGDFIDLVSKDEFITWPFEINSSLSLSENKLITAIKAANQAIYNDACKHKERKGMASTVAALLIEENYAAIAHVGDSRVYRIRKNDILQLTTDHSWVEEQIRKGLLSKEEARKHHLRNVVSRALGIEQAVEVDVKREKIESGDFFILCSDGLTNMVDDETIKTVILNNTNNFNSICQNLVNTANANGGIDNITVIVVYIENSSEQRGESREI